MKPYHLQLLSIIFDHIVLCYSSTCSRHYRPLRQFQIRVHHACVLSSAITVEVILPGDPPAAGQSYSLMCTVTGEDSLNSTINYQWFKTTPSRTQVETNSPTLTFDPLVLSDTGQYNCEVTVSSNQLSQDVLITSSNYEIMFSSKYTSNIRSTLMYTCELSKCR